MSLYNESFSTPLGTMFVHATNTHIIKIGWPNEKNMYNWLPNHITQQAKQQIAEYFNQQRTSFDLPLFYGIQNEFNVKIWKELETIPYGQVTSYKKIGENIGSKAFQAIGKANSVNPFPIVVPCHRCVKSDGTLPTKFAGTVMAQARLLALENINSTTKQTK